MYFGKVALITGIGSGIGQAAARLFCQHGAAVFGVDRNVAAGEALAIKLQAKNRKFHFYAADVSTETACQQVVCQCCQICDRVDILYNKRLI
jgi:NAD(P)-dependent dehydrogenase (short-subunit alcohol dehydrogenase family)